MRSTAWRRRTKAEGIDLIVGIESRGFILGAAVADRIGAGFVPVRKLGKLPADRVRATYNLEYGSDSLEMHRDAVQPGQRVLIVDDLLATGGTARATVDLVKQLGGTVEGVALLIELVGLNGRAQAGWREGHGRPAVLTEPDRIERFSAPVAQQDRALVS